MICFVSLGIKGGSFRVGISKVGKGRVCCRVGMIEEKFYFWFVSLRFREVFRNWLNLSCGI